MTEDEMVRWHHQLDGHESEQALGVGDSIQSPHPLLILCHPVFLPPSVFPSIRVFSSESVLRIRWPK